MPTRKRIYEDATFIVETECRPPALWIFVLIKGDPETFVDGIQSEWMTSVRCSELDRLRTVIEHLTADPTTGGYRPEDEYRQTENWGEQSVTEVLLYEEVDVPRGDRLYRLTYETVIKENGAIMWRSEVSFVLYRGTLIQIAKGLLVAMSDCCATGD